MTERFEKALVHAARLHRDQRRKGHGIPYISHLLAVCALTVEHGGDEDEAIAALLHDAIEDQGGPIARTGILREFGPRVTAIVDGCTDSVGAPKAPWRARKEEHIRHLRHASRSVRLVVACDKLHNARTLVLDYRIMGEDLWPRFRGGREGTLWYYRAISDLLHEAEVNPLTDELERTVIELERLASA